LNLIVENLPYDEIAGHRYTKEIDLQQWIENDMSNKLKNKIKKKLLTLKIQK